eukprot:Hpha_TRINITY_DN1934_c0_g1::TRINITY_DN1934_c0_g1_i2::g.31175::m.31175
MRAAHALRLHTLSAPVAQTRSTIEADPSELAGLWEELCKSARAAEQESHPGEDFQDPAREGVTLGTVYELAARFGLRPGWSAHAQTQELSIGNLAELVGSDDRTTQRVASNAGIATDASAGRLAAAGIPPPKKRLSVLVADREPSDCAGLSPKARGVLHATAATARLKILVGGASARLRRRLRQATAARGNTSVSAAQLHGSPDSTKKSPAGVVGSPPGSTRGFFCRRIPFIFC